MVKGNLRELERLLLWNKDKDEHSSDPALLYTMRAYFDESVNMGVAMSTLSVAIIGFADNFSSRMYLQIVGFVLLLAGLSIPALFSVDYFIYLRHLRADATPHFTSKKRHYAYLACIHMFIVAMITVTTIFLVQKLLDRYLY